MRRPLIDRIFLNIPTEYSPIEEQMQMTIWINPRFGEIGLFIWYILSKFSYKRRSRKFWMKERAYGFNSKT